MYKVFPRRAEHRLDAQTDALDAAMTRRFKQWETEHLTVQVHRDVALHLLWELPHHLQNTQRDKCLRQGKMGIVTNKQIRVVSSKTLRDIISIVKTSLSGGISVADRT